MTANDAAGNSATTSVSVTYIDPVPGLEQRLGETQQDLDDANDALNATRDDLGETNDALAQTTSNLAALGTQTLLLFVLLVVALGFGAAQFLSVRRMRSRASGGGDEGDAKRGAEPPGP